MRLLKELDDEDFRTYLRMTPESFVEILNFVKKYITKTDTVMRRAVTTEERLVATLKYLASGREYKDLKLSTCISPQLLSEIIPETCEAIIRVLNDYLKVPETENDWLQIAKDFERKWQFNHCLGAIDGKHVIIEKPPKSGTLYYNYKGTFSVVLLGIVNANYEFIYVNVGDWRLNDNSVSLNRTERQRTADGNSVRQIFTEYFNNQGRVHFQERMINTLNI
ncbi:hypothetical protein ACJJTC_002055 [Scirpophaga incertulas]